MSFIVYPAMISVAVLFAAGIYLMLSSETQRIVFGFLLFSNAINLAILSASGLPVDAGPPLLPSRLPMTDPLPQAFILTAIVIGLGTAAFLLAMVIRLQRGDSK